MSGYKRRILVVDDDRQLQKLLVRYLESQDLAVEAVGDGAAMWSAIERGPPDVVILDVGLPGEDGLSLARRLRAASAVGIIMLTDRSDAVDRVVGLELGADDYVAKPFGLRELLARVRSLLRRLDVRPAGPGADSGTPALATFDRWSLDTAGRELRDAGGAGVPLTPKEFELLALLVERPRRALSRDTILERIDAGQANPLDRSVDVLIHQLRGKLERDARRPELIKTVRGAGYRLDCDVEWTTGGG